MVDTLPLSAVIRERSQAAHSSSEGASFMSDLMKGTGTREDYIALVAQHYFMYRSLEGAAARMREDAIAAPFVSEELTRMPAIEADLAALLGENWLENIHPVPATQRYCDRIDEVASSWVGGYIAHHYTRYLGDLSGGQFIGKLMKRRFGFEGSGVDFYTFDAIADPAAFKDEYRAKIDAAPWDAAEQERIVEEILVAYQFNTDVFIDLQREKDAVPA